MSCCFKGSFWDLKFTLFAVVSVAVVGGQSCHWSRALESCLFKEPP